MSFGAAIRKCVADWLTWSGRAPRSEYWWFYLFFVLYAAGGIAVFFGLAALGNVDFFEVLDGFAPWSPMSYLMAGFAIVFGLSIIFLYVATISASVRRLHDVGQTGWWIGGSILLAIAIDLFETTSGPGGIVSILDIVGIGLSIAVFVFTLLRSQDGTNRYGPNPLTGEATEEVFA